MTRAALYEEVKARARALRGEYGFDSPRIGRSDIRRIYRQERIQIDYRHGLRNLRGAYFNDDMGVHVMLAHGLPDEPTIFTMGHELKHHFMDCPKDGGYLSVCADSNVAQVVEISAEVFAAELVYPEAEFARDLEQLGIARGACDARAIVQLKHETRATLSYASLAKRAVVLGFAPKGALTKVAWVKLSESVYGEPLYKRLQRRRRASA